MYFFYFISSLAQKAAWPLEREITIMLPFQFWNCSMTLFKLMKQTNHYSEGIREELHLLVIFTVLNLPFSFSVTSFLLLCGGDGVSGQLYSNFRPFCFLHLS